LTKGGLISGTNKQTKMLDPLGGSSLYTNHSFIQCQAHLVVVCGWMPAV
jgi:hypothetical protein